MTTDLAPHPAPDAAPAPPPRPRNGPRVWQIVVMVLVVGVLAGWLARTYLPEAHPGRDSVDVGFLHDMTTHHQQAVQMGLLYQQRGTDPMLGHMAREIVTSQSAEIGIFNHLLSGWDEEDPPDQPMAWMGRGMAGHAMPGMATRAELDRLDASSGTALDDEFSRLMIAHHAGGLSMAEYAAANATNAEIRSRARAIVEGQRSEISEINGRRRQLGLEPVYP
jgi:uncharacterized protein (DUF305 family)